MQCLISVYTHANPCLTFIYTHIHTYPCFIQTYTSGDYYFRSAYEYCNNGWASVTVIRRHLFKIANQAELKVDVTINSACSLKNINVIKEIIVLRSVREWRVVNSQFWNRRESMPLFWSCGEITFSCSKRLLSNALYFSLMCLLVPNFEYIRHLKIQVSIAVALCLCGYGSRRFERL
jgi:hypothetical protein